LEFARADHANAAVDADRELRGAEATYRSDIVTAEAWDQHVLGIPAAGWVPILAVGALVLLGILIWVIWLVKEAGTERRNAQLKIAQERANVEKYAEQTRLEAVKRGPCATCGALPMAQEITAAIEKGKKR
jgi:hypothetical protein